MRSNMLVAWAAVLTLSSNGTVQSQNLPEPSPATAQSPPANPQLPADKNAVSPPASGAAPAPAQNAVAPQTPPSASTGVPAGGTATGVPPAQAPATAQSPPAEPQPPNSQNAVSPPPSGAAPAATVPPPGSPVIELPPVVIEQLKPFASQPAQKVKKAGVKPAPDLATEPSLPVKAKNAPTPAPEQQPQPQPVQSVALAPPAGTIVVAPGQDFGPITTATNSEIVATRGATLTDTLQNSPGVGGSTFAPGANRPILRGLDDNRVRVQENGIGTGDVSDLSEDHAIPVDPCSADKVEVVHGPATLRYTSKAIGGVVNAENERVPTFVPANGVSGEVRGGVSSGDSGRDGCFKASSGARGFVVHADGFARHSDDYDTPQGRQLNSFVNSDGYSIGGSYVWTDGFAGVAYTRFNSLYAIPGIESAAAKGRIDMIQDKVTAKTEWRVRDFGIEAIRTWFGYSNYAHNELDFDAVAGMDAVGSRFTNKEFEARTEFEHARVLTPAGAVSGTAGIQISNRDLVGLSFGDDNLLEPNRTQKVAGFLFEELQITQPLRLLASVRIERDEIDGSTFADVTSPALPVVARDKTFDSISGGLGLLYDLPLGIVARLSGLYAERAPEAQELFSKGAHDATGTFEIGNPGIDKEKARTVELGFKRALGGVRFDTTGYYTQYEGFIFRRLTGETCDVTIDSCSPSGAGGDLKQVIFGQRDATFYGVELNGEVDVAPVWRGIWGISGQYDFVRAKFDGNENVPRIPPHRLGGGLYYRDSAWMARLYALHAFRQDEISFNETPTNGYTLLNAELSYTVKLDASGAIIPQLTIGLKGENLLDDDVRNSASFKKDEVLQPGRNVRSGA